MNSKENSNIVVVLAVRGAPPKDFPSHEMGEYFSLHLKMDLMSNLVDTSVTQRYESLKRKLYEWPRTKDNDPIYASSYELAEQIKKISGNEVLVGFNELCNPSIEEALQQALTLSPKKVIVITPMITSGGEHSEIEVPRKIKNAQTQYPAIPIIYAWPFEIEEVAHFLASRLRKYF